MEHSGNVVMKAGYEVSVGHAGVVEMIDTFDRPGKVFATGVYNGAGTYACGFENKPMQRIPKAGAYAAAGVGHTGVEWSIVRAEAKGPNAAAGVGASAGSLSARAFANAELASASASAGPVRVKVGLSVDTGVDVSPTGVELKFLGTGLSVGRKMSLALFGNEITFTLF